MEPEGAVEDGRTWARRGRWFGLGVLSVGLMIWFSGFCGSSALTEGCTDSQRLWETRGAAVFALGSLVLLAALVAEMICDVRLGSADRRLFAGLASGAMVAVCAIGLAGITWALAPR